MCVFSSESSSKASKGSGQVLLGFLPEFHGAFTLHFSGLRHHSLMSVAGVFTKQHVLMSCEIALLWDVQSYTLQNIGQLKVKVFLQMM